MRCCPVCYAKVRPTASGTCQTGTRLGIKYTIRCSRCKFGCDDIGTVVLDYDEETMAPIADDSELRRLIKTWDSILRDPEKEKETLL